MMYSREFNLKEMYISEKEDVLKKIAMLVYLRCEPEFKYQDMLLDKEIEQLTFSIGLTSQNKFIYDISKIVSLLEKPTNEVVKLFVKDRSNTFAGEIIKLIESPWITFHIGAKTYTIHWNDIEHIYAIFRNFDYYNQSLSTVYEQIKGVIK